MEEFLKKGDFEAIKRLSMADLERLWRQKAKRRTDKKRPPRVRALLVQDLAWRMQERTHNGMDAETQTLLNAAIRQAENKIDDSTAKTRKRPPTPQLQTGVTLVRKWRGKTYKVKVVKDGDGRKRYRFAGRTYRSLTLIAQEITGTHWSGPRFFGLDRVRSTG